MVNTVVHTESETCQKQCSQHPPPIIVISDFFEHIHWIQIGISCSAQQPNHGWRAAAVGSILCVLEWEFSLFYVLQYSRGNRVSRCHTHTHTHGT